MRADRVLARACGESNTGTGGASTCITPTGNHEHSGLHAGTHSTTESLLAPPGTSELRDFHSYVPMKPNIKRAARLRSEHSDRLQDGADAERNDHEPYHDLKRTRLHAVHHPCTQRRGDHSP